MLISCKNFLNKFKSFLCDKKKRKQNVILLGISKAEFANFNVYNTPFLFDRVLIKARVIDIIDMNIIICIAQINEVVYSKLVFKLAELEIPDIYTEGRGEQIEVNSIKKLFKLITNDSVTLKTVSNKNIRKALNKRVFLVNMFYCHFDTHGRISTWVFPYNNSDYHNKNNSFNRILTREIMTRSSEIVNNDV